MPARLTPVLAAALAAGVLAGPVSAATAKGPALAVSHVAAATTRTGPGRTLSVTDTTVNRGHAPAARSLTAYYLATTPRYSASAIRLGTGRSVPHLRSGGSSTTTTRVTIPLYATTGRYRLLACAAARQRLTSKPR